MVIVVDCHACLIRRLYYYLPEKKIVIRGEFHRAEKEIPLLRTLGAQIFIEGYGSTRMQKYIGNFL